MKRVIPFVLGTLAVLATVQASGPAAAPAGSALSAYAVRTTVPAASRTVTVTVAAASIVQVALVPRAMVSPSCGKNWTGVRASALSAA